MTGPYWELWDRRPNYGPEPDPDYLRDKIELGLRATGHIVGSARAEDNRRARFYFDFDRAGSRLVSLPHRWEQDEQTARRRPGPLGR